MRIVSQFAIRLEENLGSLAHVRLTTLMGEPLPEVDEERVDSATVAVPFVPKGIANPFHLPELGTFYLWTNHHGKGFSASHSPLSMAQAWFQERSTQIAQAIRTYTRKGVPLEIAQRSLEAAHSNPDRAMQLTDLVRASESLVRAVAHTRLQRLNGRPVFLWGVQVHSAQDEIAHLKHFNTLGLPLSEQGEWHALIQHAQQKRMVMIATDLVHPEYEMTVSALEAHLLKMLNRYHGYIRYWEVVRDAPTTLARTGLPSGTAIEFLTRLYQSVREIDPQAVRLLGATHSLYYYKSGLAFLDECIEQEVPFEGIHLILYWHDGDLFYFERLLEHYGDFGKPLYVTLKLPPEQSHPEFWRADAVRWIDSFCWMALSKGFIVGLIFDLHSLEPLYGDVGGALSTLLARGYNPHCYEPLE
ncbi:MAG: hypothetical protein C4336_07845 [Armatimonadota bacterium]